MSNYKKVASNIQQITITNPTTTNQVVWLNVINAGKKELDYLRKKFDFELPYLHASLANTTAQRPVINREENYLFMILHFPVIKDGNIVAEEIDFFISHGYLITIHNNKLEALNQFFNSCKKDINSLLAYQFESSAVLLYELLEKLMLNCFGLLDKNSLSIAKVEEIIFAQKQKQAVSQILSLRHGIINFRKIMQNHKNIIKKLAQMESSIVPAEQIKVYYNRLIERSKQIWEILENQKEMIEVLNNTNESLLNYRLSDIMKTLTIFSVIVFPLTLLAAIFGMNILDGMPLIHIRHGFWIIISIMLTGSLIMLLFFERKKWL